LVQDKANLVKGKG